MMTVKEELKWILNHLNIDELDDEQANALVSLISLFQDSVIPTKEELKAIHKYEKGDMKFVDFESFANEMGFEF
ncbi:hypothetical protein [Granulicatella sp.]